MINSREPALMIKNISKYFYLYLVIYFMTQRPYSDCLCCKVDMKTSGANFFKTMKVIHAFSTRPAHDKTY